MSDPVHPDDQAVLARLTRTLRMVTVPLPHLSGLAAGVRFALDATVPTIGVFASGRMVANRGFISGLSNDDLLFVLAHELLHLALRTHERAPGSDRLEFNVAHDYIINDMLRHALGRTGIPAGGLDMEGARLRSAEEIVLEQRRKRAGSPPPTQVWGTLRIVLDMRAGGDPSSSGVPAGDVFDEALERQMFPQEAEALAARAKAMRELAMRGMALAKALAGTGGRGTSAGGTEQAVRALRGVYRTPWQVALQRWLEGTTAGERTFMRASRRGAERTDIVMPGRHRHALTLNVIIDTSGSMANDLPAVLGAIADFCEAVGIDDIRLVQCDTEVTGDEVLSPAELAEYQVRGFGGSDLTPALAALAADPRVTAAVVVTDGDISYPPDPVPYAVLWAIPGDFTLFAPPYGRVITMQREKTP